MDESNKKRREKIMRMMEKGSSSKAKEAIVGSSTHAPSFARMAFVERWRASKAANDVNTSIKLSDGLHRDMGSTSATDEQRPVPKKKSKKKKVVEDEGPEAKDASPPAPAPAAKKKSKKKAAQKDVKDQAAEREQAEREAAAAAAAAAKVKEEESTKKSKKGKKKDQAAQQQQAQQQAAQAQAMAMAQVQALAQAQADAAEAESNKKSGKKTAKLKKAKIQPAAKPSNPSEIQQQQQQQQPYGGAPPPQMYQQMLNYQAQSMNQGSPASGLSAASYPGMFAGNLTGGGLALPGQAGNYTNVQQQIQQAAAAQRGLQQQPGMNGNFMMNPQMQQHLQALAAMQQQNLSHSPQSMPASQPLQQGPFNAQDNALPVGVGLGNLPPNWNTMA